MFNRPLNAVLTRLAIVAAVLATLMLLAPAASAQAINPMEVTYAENDTVPIGTYIAVDPEGEDIEWSVSDEKNFAIDAGGLLTFKKSPDFETKSSYSVGVMANKAPLLTVTITITNVEEGATVTMDQPQPQVGQMVTATLKDKDGGETSMMWQWSKSSDMATWEDIDGATVISYTPKSADVGSYLRATVSYIDAAKPADDTSTADVDESETRDVEAGVSEESVEGSPNANASPMFAPDVDPDPDDGDDTATIFRIMVDENTTGEIGDAVVASDADNDVLLYSIVEDPPLAAEVAARFAINKRSGQISVTDETVLNAATDEDITGGNNDADYDVTVTVTDPSGATGTVTVNIVVGNVDEAPTGLGSDDDSTKLTIGEDSEDVDTTPDSPLAAPDTENLNYTAADPENVTLVWSVSGADGALFSADGGTLTFTPPATAAAPDHETKGEYKITIEVKGGADSTAVSKLDVTIEVTNVDEGGTVTLSARQPQVGNPVMASLKDPDGGETGVMWQWSRQVSGTPADPNADCPDAADGGGWTDITGAESASYTPKTTDATYCLQATAMYMDDAEAAVGDRNPARGATDRAVEVKPTANDAPKFTDDEKPDGADPVEIEVPENTTGMIGDPFSANEANDDALMYTLGGDDGGSFSITRDDGGQISVGSGTKLDYETKTMYSLTVTATDPSGASDTVDVTIMLKGVDEDPVAPMGATNPDKVTYAENDTDPIGTYIAVDPEGEDIEWSVSDDKNFAIDADGVLTFTSPPDFEDPPPSTVGVIANEAAEPLVTVTITFTNMEEGATVTMDQPQPQAGQPVMASVDDKDMGETDQMWQWSKSSDMSDWEDIDGATQQSHTPKSADVGSYLRATVSYIDAAKPADDTSTADVDESETRDVEAGVSEEPVEGSPDANAPPKFAPDVDPTPDDGDDTATIFRIMVDENTTGEIGGAVVASDADNDVLLYSIVEDPPLTEGVAARFAINKRSGQISVTDETVLNAATDEDITGGNNDADYDVTVTVTDPSGATGTVTVNIVVGNVDEAPTGLGSDDDSTKLTIGEDSEDVDTTPDSPLAAPDTENLNYTAADPENVTLVWSVSGADGALFSADGGTLTFTPPATAAAPDHETKGEYKITIEVKGGADSTAVSKLDVTIEVTNVDEGGTVTLSARQPQVGNPVMASLKDPDGGETGVMWQWSRQVSGTPADPNADCPDAADGGGWTDITGAESASYTPKTTDATYCLQATAMYMDDAEAAVGDRNPARGATERAAEVKPAANDAPKFTDDEKPDGADPVEIEVPENTTGMIGDPFSANEANDDVLMYTLGGDDGGSFSITRDDGQISVGSGTKLDYETKTMYSLTVTATDPSGATDTVDVTVTLMDVDEPPVLAMTPPAPAENVAPAFADDTAEFMVYENMDAGTAVGTVTADDEGDVLTYSDDSGYFDVDDSGNITTAMMLDHEAMASHTVTVTATDDEDASDSIMVTITVTDMYPDCTVMDNDGLTNDCEALLDSMGALGGTLDWDASTDVSGWEGVTVSGDPMRVTSLNLRAEGTGGMIPAALGRLEMLTYLNLRNNDLTGEIPGSLNNLGNLTYLGLNNNMLSGDIPALGGLTMLEELYLSGNDLTGGVPEWLNGMTNLRELWLWGNDLGGEIPDLSGMSSLVRIKLQVTGLTDGVKLTFNANLMYLNIGDNPGLGGGIPDLSGLPALVSLSIHNSGLTGTIHDSVGMLTDMRRLNLRDNMLDGVIPDLSGLDDMTHLRLHNNMLSGMIPATLGDLDSLGYLWLHGNMLSGQIPMELGGLADTLMVINLMGNSFADDACLPAALGDVGTNDSGLPTCSTGDGS